MPKRKSVTDTKDDLFQSSGAQPQVVTSGDWKIVLEQRNLMYMLAAGMVMSPKGLAGKYYEDSLAVCPGWIPIFKGNVPSGAIEQAESEGKSSRPVTASIGINAISGEVYACTGSGAPRQIQFPDGLKPDDTILLIPAPLPATWLTGLEFVCASDKDMWEESIREFGNVSGGDLGLRLCAPPVVDELPNWPIDVAGVEERDHSPDLALAFGGCLGVLYRLMGRSEEGVRIARYAFGDDAKLSDDLDDLFKPMVKAGFASTEPDGVSEYFWKPVEALAKVRTGTVSRSHLDALLDSLDELAAEADGKAASGLRKLAGELRDVTGFSDKSISEIFERYPKRISRAMLLFALRSSVDGLLEFEYDMLSHQDYLAAAILFGTRDGWIGLSKELKSMPDLSRVVCHLMAEMEHERRGSGITLGEPPKREESLWELLVAEPMPWRSIVQKAAIELASRQKWTDCIRTTIKLKAGEYQLSSTQSNLVFDFDGKVDVQEKVKEELFIARVHDSNLSDKDIEVFKNALTKTK